MKDIFDSPEVTLPVDVAPNRQIGERLEILQRNIQGHRFTEWMGNQYDSLHEELGYTPRSSETYEGAVTILGGSQPHEMIYEPGKGRYDYTVDDHVRGLTAMIANAPALIPLDRIKYIRQIVKTASTPEYLSEEFGETPYKTADRTMSARSARATVLDQIRATVIREEFRLQADTAESRRVYDRHAEIYEELRVGWLFAPDRVAKVVASSAGIVGALLLRRKLHR